MTETNVLELVRSYFPDLPDDELEHILWGRTGYPSFFVAGDPIVVLQKQLKEYAAARSKYPHVCEFCNSPGTVVSSGCLCETHQKCLEVTE